MFKLAHDVTSGPDSLLSSWARGIKPPAPTTNEVNVMQFFEFLPGSLDYVAELGSDEHHSGIRADRA